MANTKILKIIGGGMAGCEAAWQAANMGVHVHLYEMRPKVKTFAAGGALAVDRDNFAICVTNKVNQHPKIKVINEENVDLENNDMLIVATGPLTSERLAASIRKLTGNDALSFYDAIAPIVYRDTIDMSKAWMQSRYDKGDTEQERKAYLNCPMSKEQYEKFVDALLEAEKTEFHENEQADYFNGCLPIEVMAERGRETLRFGPMKPVGLTNPNNKEKPYAVSNKNEVRITKKCFFYDTRLRKCKFCAIRWNSP